MRTVRALATGVLLAALFAFAALGARAVQGWLDIDPALATILCGVGIAAGFLLVRRYLEPSLAPLVHRDDDRLREGIEHLLHELAAGGTREHVLTTVADRLFALFQATYVTARVREDDAFVVVASRGTPPTPLPELLGAGDALTDSDAALVLPIHRGGLPVALLTLGRGRAGRAYGQTERTLLGAVVTQLESMLLRLDLGRYAPARVVALLAAHPDRLEPASRPVTILFAQVAAVDQSAGEDLLGVLVEVVEAGTGTVVKTLGDGVLALWNAPEEAVAHETQGAQAALDMLAAVARLGMPPGTLRVGLHTGSALVGNFGTAERLEYDVRGDAVNLTARLAGLGRLYGVAIVVSSPVRAALGEAFVCRSLDRVRVVGRREPVEVSELVGPCSLSAATQRLVAAFETVVTSYRARAFAEALADIDRLAVLYPDDQPTRLYQARCRTFIADPPDAAWDAVFEATSK